MTRAAPGRLRIWLVDEGAHGHRAQAEGVVAALGRLGHASDVYHVAARDRVPGIWRAPVRALVDRAPEALAARAARRVSTFAPPHAPSPDLVLSSGGKSAFANVVLARETGAANLFVGDPRPYPPRWFHAVLAPRPVPGAGNVWTVAAPPTTMTPARCEAAARARWGERVPAAVWTLLVGGASRSHRFTRADFEHLADGADALARRYGIRWLVATSRRSGAAADDVLAARLDPAVVAEATWFSRAPEPVVPAYLGAGAIQFVTRDSLTMLSEAMASGRPVVALAPATVRLPRGSIVSEMLARFSALPGFVQQPIATMAHAAPPDDAAPYAEIVADLDRAVADVLRHLGLG